jgi:hypothetical protein
MNAVVSSRSKSATILRNPLDGFSLVDELACVLLNIVGELLLGLVLRHCGGAQGFLLLSANGPAGGVRHIEMEKADPDLAFARPVNPLDPALRSLGSSQLLWLWRAPDVANVDLDDGSECGARIGGLVGGRRGR